MKSTEQLYAIYKDLSQRCEAGEFSWWNAFEEMYLQGFRKLKRMEDDMRAGGKNVPSPRAKGASKQFGGGGGKTPFTATPKKATASMMGSEPPSEAPAKSITRKDAKKNTVRGGGRKVF